MGILILLQGWTSSCLNIIATLTQTLRACTPTECTTHTDCRCPCFPALVDTGAPIDRLLGAGDSHRRRLQAAPSLAVTYKGCYKDVSGSHAFSTNAGQMTMADCVAATVAAGSSLFAMQSPAPGDTASATCYVLGKGLLSEDSANTYGKVADSECQGAAWQPTYGSQSFAYNGGTLRNAVYSHLPTQALGLSVSNLATGRAAIVSTDNGGSASRAVDGNQDPVSSVHLKLLILAMPNQSSTLGRDCDCSTIMAIGVVTKHT